MTRNGGGQVEQKIAGLKQRRKNVEVVGLDYRVFDETDAEFPGNTPPIQADLPFNHQEIPGRKMLLEQGNEGLAYIAEAQEYNLCHSITSPPFGPSVCPA